MVLLIIFYKQDDFQSGNHKDESNKREIIKKKKTSKRSVFQDPSFIRSLCKVRSRGGRGLTVSLRTLMCGVSLERLFKSGVFLEDCKGCLESKIGTIIQLYCLKAWFENLEIEEPQAWD
ncbi:hypothetical protein AAG906_030825 [Vitis piasezkii]